MKLKALHIDGFRGFSRALSIDLDADTVIVFGVNGSGKTSLFDAILWALTGSIERLNCDAGDVVSKYSATGEARVELEIWREDSVLRVIRRFDNADRLTVVNGDDGEALNGTAAEAMLIDLLWPDAKAASIPMEALSRSLTRSMYLQQDVVRQFVEADGEEGRFRVIGELVGVGRVTELQKQLESSKSSWSRATNILEKELVPLRNQISGLEDRLRRLEATGAPVLDDQTFEDWWSEATVLAGGSASKQPVKRSIESLDTILSLLEERQRREERSRALLQRLLTHLRSPVAEAESLEAIRSRVSDIESRVEERSQQLLREEQASADERRRQTEESDRAESLRTLAILALSHLGDVCPVCSQIYDRDATRERLESIAESHGVAWKVQARNAVQLAAEELEAAEKDYAIINEELRRIEAANVALARWQQETNDLVADLEIVGEKDLQLAAESRLSLADSVVESLQRFRSMGEELSLLLAREREQSQRVEVESQLASLRGELADKVDEWTARVDSGEMASRLLGAIRGASTNIVADELSRIGPLLQRIYSAVDPHPSFRAVRFLTRTPRGHGRVWTTIADDVEQKTAEEPSAVLSSSQLNVLAVSTFLSLNLAIDSLPLQVVALDDPLQSLDTINLLGLADLLRRIRASRQVVISTHDLQLANLLQRKLRPLENERTCVVSLDAWSRIGPIVEQFDLTPDMSPLKLVSSG